MLSPASRGCVAGAVCVHLCHRRSTDACTIQRSHHLFAAGFVDVTVHTSLFVGSAHPPGGPVRGPSTPAEGSRPWARHVCQGILSVGSVHLLGDLRFLRVGLGLGRSPGRLPCGLSGSAFSCSVGPQLFFQLSGWAAPSPHACFPWLPTLLLLPPPL